MLNILKKVEESRQNLGDIKNNGFEPPKNLPDLAKDIYERESIGESKTSNVGNNNAATVNSASNVVSAVSSKALEPSNVSVPKLDLSLVRSQVNSSNPVLSAPGSHPMSDSQQNLSANNNFVSTNVSQPNPTITQKALSTNNPATINPAMINTVATTPLSSSSQESQNNITNQILLQVLQTLIDQQSKSPQSNPSPNLNYPYTAVASQTYPASNYIAPNYYLPNYPLYPQLNSPYYPNTIPQSLNSQISMPFLTQSLPNVHETTATSSGFNYGGINSGFFKEFEDYIKNSTIPNDVLGLLLNKNFLDQMISYYALKDENKQYSGSTLEFSHLIQLRLEELQNLEKNWLVNKRKLDLLKKIGSVMESDVHLKSEELKKIIKESKKMETTTKSDDFLKMISVPLTNSTSFNSTSNNFFNNISNKDVFNPSLINSSEKSSTNVNTSINVNNSLASPKISLNNYVNTDSSKYFYVRNGQIFKSLNDFILGLEKMDDGTFNYHVNSAKNDFATWIKVVFNDTILSDSIKPLMTREKLLSYFKSLIV